MEVVSKEDYFIFKGYGWNLDGSSEGLSSIYKGKIKNRILHVSKPKVVKLAQVEFFLENINSQDYVDSIELTKGKCDPSANDAPFNVN